MKKWQWYVAFILCITIISSSRWPNEELQTAVQQIVFTNNDIRYIRSAVSEILGGVQTVEVASPAGASFLHYHQVVPFQEGFTFFYEKSISIMAPNRGVVLFTGHSANRGRTLSLLLDNGYTVTYGLLHNIIVLPYTSVKKGSLLAVTQPGNVWIMLEYEGRKLDLAETILWLKGRS